MWFSLSVVIILDMSITARRYGTLMMPPLYYTLPYPHTKSYEIVEVFLAFGRIAVFKFLEDNLK